MRLVSEHEAGEARARLLSCDECDPEVECETRFLVFQAHHRVLWVALSWTDGGDEEALDDLELIVDRIANLPDVIERYLALAGLPFSRLLSSGEACMDQILICADIPQWMLRLDRRLLWRTRGCVVGNELTRVPQALAIMDSHYQPDCPVLVRDG